MPTSQHEIRFRHERTPEGFRFTAIAPPRYAGCYTRVIDYRRAVTLPEARAAMREDFPNATFWREHTR